MMNSGIMVKRTIRGAGFACMLIMLAGNFAHGQGYYQVTPAPYGSGYGTGTGSYNPYGSSGYGSQYGSGMYGSGSGMYGSGMGGYGSGMYGSSGYGGYGGSGRLGNRVLRSRSKSKRAFSIGVPATSIRDSSRLPRPFCSASSSQLSQLMNGAAPAGAGYYILKDKGPNILIIPMAVKDSLDQQLTALRNKSLWAFDPAQVKSLKIRMDKTQVDLEKTGATAWRWVGRPNFRVRADRVDQLLSQLSEAQITAFPPAPKDLKAAGLAPPAKTEVTITTPQGVPGGPNAR